MCSLDVNNQHKAITELPLSNVPEHIYAVCAVESYGVTTKPQGYPATAITLSSIDLQLQNNSMNPIHWIANKNNLGLDFKTNPTMGGAKVEFKLA
jgi:hypothetical protein